MIRGFPDPGYESRESGVVGLLSGCFCWFGFDRGCEICEYAASASWLTGYVVIRSQLEII